MCQCGKWDSVCGQYFAELVRIEVYPLEVLFSKTSINVILSRMKSFDMETVGNKCGFCNVPWDSQVERARSMTSNNFDGVCMDCMNVSRPNGRNPDDEYWLKLGNTNGRWDKKCRVVHGQQTWYVSWCGRDEHRRKLIEDHKRRTGRDMF